MDQGDLVLNRSLFDPSSIPAQVATTSENIKKLTEQTPLWWDIGAPKYRELRRNGGSTMPKAIYLDGTPAHIQSRDSGRTIPVRIMKPDRKVMIKSVVMYIHGGGWVTMAEDLYDPLIKQIANGTDSLVVSVGYRLAPEDPWPAGVNDCNDVADWLVDNAEQQYGAALQFIGGDSAGGNLSMTSFMHLHASRPDFQLSGLILYYGGYDLSGLPQSHIYDGGAILTPDILDHYLAAYVPGQNLKNPAISPMYQDLRGWRLPAALFLCGTNDALLDDSCFMHVKWQMAGGESMLKIYPGAPHAFMVQPAQVMPCQDEGMKLTCKFVTEKRK